MIRSCTSRSAGERLPSAAMLRVARAVAQNLTGRLRKGSRRSMRQQVGEALQTLPPRELTQETSLASGEDAP